MMELSNEEKEKLRSYLWADSGAGDLTSVVFGEDMGSAVVISEEECFISGIEEARFIFEEEGCTVQMVPEAFDDALCNPGSEVMIVSGPVTGMLRAERIVLNILSRMSGIATMASRAAGIAAKASAGTRVAGTRKTTPGFSLFEKRALIDGGALPHRKDLSSLAMLKDNHISAIGGGLDPVIKGVKMIRERFGPYIPIEVEVEDMRSGLAAVEAGADIIMLDNIPPKDLERISKGLRKRGLEIGSKVTLEASGGITLEHIPEYAPYVDIISMGVLTYGATPKGFKMEYRGEIEPLDAG